MISISILAVQGCLHSAVHGLGEILTLANSRLEVPMFEVGVISEDGTPSVSYTGTKVIAHGRMEDANCDIVVLPPIIGTVDLVLRQAKVLDWLKEQHVSGRMVASVCAGSFLLAETGALDNRIATTHWHLAQQFRERYPNVDLQIERLLVDGGDYICAGGVSAWMDLSLHLISRYLGREDALACAKMMLMDPHRDYQTPYGMGGFPKNHGDSQILRVQTWLEDNYPSQPRLKDMASEACLGERTLLRRFKAATGVTPLRYLQQIRMAAAQSLLEQSDQSIDDVARAVGYEDYSSFRKTFKQILGTTPSAYRQRFSLIV